MKEYAAELHVTPKHLSQTIKEVTGKTAKTYIRDRLALEAKRLLLHTDMAVKDVAYALGYGEPLHFSAFFKEHIGVAPSRYRKRLAS